MYITQKLKNITTSINVWKNYYVIIYFFKLINGYNHRIMSFNADDRKFGGVKVHLLMWREK